MVRALGGLLVLLLLAPSIAPLFVRGEPLSAVRLSEVCTDPQHDWSSNGFDGTPGLGSITGSDEFIEIVNVGDLPVDLTGWRIETTDSATDVDGIDAGLVANADDVSAMPPGAHWILGNPVGDMNNDVQVRLIDALDTVVDHVSLGSFEDGDVFDNAPSGNASSVDDEVVARDDLTTDTDRDADDWRQMSHTMGTVNKPFPVVDDEEPGADVPNDDGSGTDVPVDGGVFVPDRSSRVRLSELFPDPDDEDDEFIELFNPERRAVDLAGWSVSDATRTFTFPQERGRFIVPNRGYLVVERADSRLALNNSGGELVRLADADERVIDEVAYDGTARPSWSYARIGDAWIWTDHVTAGSENIVVNEPPELVIEGPDRGRVGQTLTWSAAAVDPDGDAVIVTWTLGKRTVVDHEFSRTFERAGKITITVRADDGRGGFTESIQHVTIQDFDRSDRISINEVFPNPDGPDAELEWIEVINLDARAVDLAGWQITNGRTPYVVPEGVTIASEEFALFARTETTIALRNSEETVSILDPDDRKVFSTTYTSAPSDTAWARRTDGTWGWAVSTPGETNGEDASTDSADEEPDDEYPSSPIADARTLTANARVTVTGVVTSVPGTFADRIGYLVDATGGIAFLLPTDAQDALTVGDRVSLGGKLSRLSHGVRLRVEAERIAHDGSVSVEPATITVAADLAVRPDQLVQVRGTIRTRSRRTLTVGLDTGDVRIAVPTKLDIDLEPFVADREITATGIVDLTQGQPRLLPRDAEDLTFVGTVAGATSVTSTPESIAMETAPLGQNDLLWYGLLGVSVLCGGGVIVVRKIRTRMKSGAPSSLGAPGS